MSSATKSVFPPVMDFILLGGASLLIFPLVMYLLPEGMLSSFKFWPWILVGIFYLDYFTNFPHFAYSYQLLYKDFLKKVTGRIDQALRHRYVFAGIIVLAAMTVIFLFGILQNSTALLKHSVNVMLLTAGWHYAKQGFGAL